MRIHRYLVRITKDADSDWGASVPDLPGCVATGKTVDAVLRRIEGAMRLHMQGLVEEGLEIPAPRRRTVTPRHTARRVDIWTTVEVAA